MFSWQEVRRPGKQEKMDTSIAKIHKIEKMTFMHSCMAEEINYTVWLIIYSVKRQVGLHVSKYVIPLNNRN